MPSLGVREAVSGSSRATMRLNAFAWCSRGCFGKPPGDYET